GDYQIWRAGLPESGTLPLGYLIALLVNVAAWLAGRRRFSRAVSSGYSQLFLFCAVLYLPLAVTAAVVDAEYNRINKYHLDQRRPDAYIVRNPEAVKQFGLQSGTNST